MLLDKSSFPRDKVARLFRFSPLWVSLLSAQHLSRPELTSSSISFRLSAKPPSWERSLRLSGCVRKTGVIRQKQYPNCHVGQSRSSLDHLDTLSWLSLRGLPRQHPISANDESTFGCRRHCSFPSTGGSHYDRSVGKFHGKAETGQLPLGRVAPCSIYQDSLAPSLHTSPRRLLWLAELGECNLYPKQQPESAVPKLAQPSPSRIRIQGTANKAKSLNRLECVWGTI